MVWSSQFCWWEKFSKTRIESLNRAIEDNKQGALKQACETYELSKMDLET